MACTVDLVVPGPLTAWALVQKEPILPGKLDLSEGVKGLSENLSHSLTIALTHIFLASVLQFSWCFAIKCLLSLNCLMDKYHLSWSCQKEN